MILTKSLLSVSQLNYAVFLDVEWIKYLLSSALAFPISSEIVLWKNHGKE